MSVKVRFGLSILFFTMLVACCVTIGFFSKYVSNEFAVQIVLFATALSGICFPVFFVSAARKYVEERHGSPIARFLKKILKMR
jgi:hypothetical protein